MSKSSPKRIVKRLTNGAGKLAPSTSAPYSSSQMSAHPLPVPAPDFGPVIGPPRPWIVAPAYGNMLTTVYVRSVLRYMQIYYAQYGQWPAVDWIGQESCVPRARNNLARMAMLHPTPPTHLVFVDTDIEFEPQDLHDMLCSSLPIVVGPYAKKAFNWKQALDMVQAGKVSTPEELELCGTDPVTNFHDDHIEGKQIPYVPQTGPDGKPTGKMYMVCKESGCGFMAIRIEVLRHMIKAYPARRYICDDSTGPGQETFNLFSNEVDPYPVDPTNPRFITEDYLFSRLAQRLGIPTFCYVQARLGHQGTMVYKAALARAFAAPTAAQVSPPSAGTTDVAPVVAAP
jgi:hypothetical protein